MENNFTDLDVSDTFQESILVYRFMSVVLKDTADIHIYFVGQIGFLSFNSSLFVTIVFE
jgi:hypothetical protein